MNNSLMRFAGLVGIASLSLAGTANALTPKKTLVRKVGLISERTHERLSRVHSLMVSEKFETALSELTKLEESTSSRPHEYAQVLQTKGYLLANANRFAEAESVMTKALTLEALPVSATLSTMFTVGQLQLAQENYRVALGTLLDWRDYVEDVHPEALIVIATIHTQLKDFEAALTLAKEAVEQTAVPKESWYQLLLALHFELEQYQEASHILIQMVGSYPDKKQYWRQLAGVYLNLEQNAMALAVMELAHKRGYLSEEKEIIELARLYLMREVPYRAARLLQMKLNDKAIAHNAENYELLADSWLQAKAAEKAIDAMQIAADKSDSGQTLVRLGQLLAEKERWQEAAAALEKGLRRGGVKRPGAARLALGIAQFNLNHRSAAVETFRLASHDAQVKTHAERWIAYAQQ